MDMLPGLVVHADWGSNPAKRWMSVARLDESAYRVDAPEPVGNVRTLIPRLLHRAGGAKVVLGFDFPIGLPAAYAQKASIENFLTALREFGTGTWIMFYNLAEIASDISIYRPFYPFRPGGTQQSHLVRGLGVDSIDHLRRTCERQRSDRNAACPLFWTLGSNQVGRAAIIGWRDVLVPAIADDAINVGIWPFQGDFERLVQDRSCVVVETYPAEACVHVGLTPPGRGWSKRAQKNRKEQASTLLDWVYNHPVNLALAAETALRDGFGPSPDGEDPFDSFVGLLSMLEVVTGGRREGAPEDDTTRQIEGWIFGQEVPEVSNRPGKLGRRLRQPRNSKEIQVRSLLDRIKEATERRK